MAEAYDYIIVGAGAAGCVLADRLTGDPKNRVLVLEAGGNDGNLWIRVPAGVTRTLRNPAVSWCYETANEAQLNGRRLFYPQGKTLGGSSSINGHLYVRGQPGDYDHWARLGNRGWSYQDVLPHFKRAETRRGGDPAIRGDDGPLQIQDQRDTHPLVHAFVEAAVAMGLPRNPDYNSGTQEGAGFYQQMMREGRRWSAADAYLKPALRRPNLRLVTRALAERVVLNGRRAVGVVYCRHGREFEARAGREVILCGGAINSPQLLQLSGIGPGDVLRAAGVEVAHELAGVGRNLRDHYIARVQARVQGIATVNELARGPALLGQILRYAVARRGILSMSPGQGHAFARSRPELDRPDLQLIFAPASHGDPRLGAAGLEREPGMTCGALQLRPESQGVCEILSADPTQPPVIRPNYLAEEGDRRVLVAGLAIARRITRTPPLAHYVASEVLPGDEVECEDAWLDFARATGASLHHPIGTCRMGPDPLAVVDERLRVHGLAGLRVIDASVMPTMPSGNTYAPTNMIAEKGASMLLDDRAS